MVATLVIAVASAPSHSHSTRALPALLLTVPVVAAAVVGGRAPGFAVAGFATLAFSLALPPFGSPRVGLPEDVLALIVFSATSVVVSALVTTKVSALRHLDDQRRALLRSVSHDLRTPLSAIRAVATDLRAGAVYSDREHDDLLDIVIDEAERLDRFVANMLSLSRIEAGNMRPRFAEVDVAELAGLCAERLERIFHSWHLELAVPADLPMVRADPAQLEQVLNNLLENVTRHTRGGTSVRVTARAAGSHVEITVADDGGGIPAERQERKERQEQRSSPTGDGAHGVGLTICRSIVELHGGTFRIYDNCPGTRVAICLPCVR